MSTAIRQKTEITREINELHGGLMDLGKLTIEKALRIGELLTKEKAKIPHGNWQLWIETNLNFGLTTANNYMRLYQQREKVKSATVADLTSAYKLLSESDLPEVPDFIDPKTFKKKPRKKRATSIRIRERCPTCGRVMTKEILARIKKRARTNEYSVN